jgi:hypothetical protein
MKMNRITDKDLKILCDRLNTMTNNPLTPWTKNDSGFVANIGNYHIDGAYGGVQLVQMCSDGGGVRQPLGGGFLTKRELYDRMRAFMTGIERGKK